MPHRKNFLLSDLNQRTQTDMDVVLELVCRELPHGGRHDERKYVAERLIGCAGSGQTTLGVCRSSRAVRCSICRTRNRPNQLLHRRLNRHDARRVLFGDAPAPSA